MTDPLFEYALNAVRNDPAKNSFVRGHSDRSVAVYDAVKKELEERARNAASPANPNASQAVSGATGGLAGDVRNMAIASDRAAHGGPAAASPYADALAMQAQLRAQHLEPLQRGPLGRMADKDTTTRKAIEAVFGTESKVAGSEREIETAMRALAQRNPNAARQLVRAHVEMTFDKAARDLQGGANQFGAANFAKDIIGNPDVLSHIAGAILAKAQTRPNDMLAIEVGFLDRFARLAYVGSSN
jgi:DNA-binding GntR family transcriptional regulator